MKKAVGVAILEKMGYVKKNKPGDADTMEHKGYQGNGSQSPGNVVCVSAGVLDEFLYPGKKKRSTGLKTPFLRREQTRMDYA